MLLFISVIVFPLAGRGFQCLVRTPQATTNIYEQQYQMGLFLSKFYEGEGVAANDIGAINYVADIKLLDLAGLGSLEVAEAIRGRCYDTRQIYELSETKRVKIAIVYEHRFEEYGGMPSQWIKIGEWKISDNVVCGSDTVSFYAVDPKAEDKLIENLRSFSHQLPVDVEETGKYMME